MSLSERFVDRHIQVWSERLSATGYSFRQSWPRLLFRHEPLENAASIIRDRLLLSRARSVGRRQLDIAGADVIALTDRAHSYARLYFRPRNPTQYHVEGVKKVTDPFFNGEVRVHAPILTMFVFSARRILTSPKVEFSDGNMQTKGTETGNSEAFFETIDFQKVYHMGGIGGDYSIITSRCAEVLVPEALPLNEYLEGIYCRSQAERTTLLHHIGNEADFWAPKIFVSADQTMFERRYTLVESVLLRRTGIEFQLNPRSDLQKVRVKITVNDVEDGKKFVYGPNEIPAVPSNGRRYLANFDLTGQGYDVQIELEDNFAFGARLYRSDGPL